MSEFFLFIYLISINKYEGNIFNIHMNLYLQLYFPYEMNNNFGKLFSNYNKFFFETYLKL